MNLIKPDKLKKGDKVATVSLSWGGAGDENILWRYNQGKRRLEEVFDLEVVEMPNTLAGSEFIYNNPEKRAKDLMMAFEDKSIKGIFTCIGGYDSVRMLPYINYDIIKKNPKVFVGYSDTTVSHFICMKAGLSSFYGPSILAEFAENIEMFDYTTRYFEKAVFNNEVIGEIDSSNIWTSEFLPWEEKNKNIRRKTYNHQGYEVIQGEGKVQGHLIGGCIEVLEMIKGTEIWPSLNKWKDSIIFFESSEDKPEPMYIEYWLRNYGSLGILQNAKGLIFGKPYDNKYYDEYKEVIIKVVKNELKLDIPIIYNMNFGHTAPMFTIPIGVKAEIDCEKKEFKILEKGVL